MTYEYLTDRCSSCFPLYLATVSGTALFVSFMPFLTLPLSSPFPLRAGDVIHPAPWGKGSVNNTHTYTKSVLVWLRPTMYVMYYVIVCMVTIASFLEIIAILGQDSGRANEITVLQNCRRTFSIIIITRVYPWKFHGLVNLLCSFRS